MFGHEAPSKGISSGRRVALAFWGDNWRRLSTREELGGAGASFGPQPFRDLGATDSPRGGVGRERIEALEERVAIAGLLDQ